MGWATWSLVIALAISVVLALPKGPQLHQKFKHNVPTAIKLPKYLDNLAKASETTFERSLGHDINKKSLEIRGKRQNYRYLI